MSRKSWAKAFTAIIVLAVLGGLKAAMMLVSAQVVEGYQVEVLPSGSEVTVTLRKPGQPRSGSPAAMARLSPAGNDHPDSTQWTAPHDRGRGAAGRDPMWSSRLEAPAKGEAKRQQVIVEF